MKKLVLTLSLCALLGVSLIAFAAYNYSGEAPYIQVDIWTLMNRVLNWFFGIVIVLAAIMLVWAGFSYVTSAGNEEKMKTALNTLIYALIGVAIALLAKGLIYMVCTLVNQGGNCSFF